MTRKGSAPVGFADGDFLQPLARYFAGGYLFHYTSVAGLLGIAKSKSLWASHALYMNDPQEILHAYQLLVKVVAGLKRSARTDERRHVLTHFGRWVACLDGTLPIFVFCLTEAGDSLNHWRLYTPSRKGVAIGLPVEVLKSAAARAGFRLVKCVYESKSQRIVLREMVNSIVEKADVHAAMKLTDEDSRVLPYHGFFESHLCDIATVMASLKMDHFSDEREWRLVSQCNRRHQMPDDVQFRLGASLLLPYVEISLKEELDKHEGSLLLGCDPELDPLARDALFAFAINSKLVGLMRDSLVPLKRY